MNASGFSAARRALGLTQPDLARVLGVHVGSIARYETGWTIPGPVARLLALLARRPGLLLDLRGLDEAPRRPGPEGRRGDLRPVRPRGNTPGTPRRAKRPVGVV